MIFRQKFAFVLLILVSACSTSQSSRKPSNADDYVVCQFEKIKSINKVYQITWEPIGKPHEYGWTNKRSFHGTTPLIENNKNPLGGYVQLSVDDVTGNRLHMTFFEPDHHEDFFNWNGSMIVKEFSSVEGSAEKPLTLRYHDFRVSCKPPK
jgi:hypothetical protein